MTREILGFGLQLPSAGTTVHGTRSGGQLQASGAGVRRERRGLAYLAAIERLSAASTVTPEDRAALEHMIAAAFPDPRDLIPEGFVSKCHLGPEYDVHEIDVACYILRHFLDGQPMPDQLAPARRLAVHPDYRFIEVYPKRLACIRHDGSVVEVEK